MKVKCFFHINAQLDKNQHSIGTFCHRLVLVVGRSTHDDVMSVKTFFNVNLRLISEFLWLVLGGRQLSSLRRSQNAEENGFYQDIGEGSSSSISVCWNIDDVLMLFFVFRYA